MVPEFPGLRGSQGLGMYDNGSQKEGRSTVLWMGPAYLVQQQWKRLITRKVSRKFGIVVKQNQQVTCVVADTSERVLEARKGSNKVSVSCLYRESVTGNSLSAEEVERSTFIHFLEWRHTWKTHEDWMIGGLNSEVLRHTGGRGAKSVALVLQGEGRGHLFPKSALRNISIAPYVRVCHTGLLFRSRLGWLFWTTSQSLLLSCSQVAKWGLANTADVKSAYDFYFPEVSRLKWIVSFLSSIISSLHSFYILLSGFIIFLQLRHAYILSFHSSIKFLNIGVAGFAWIYNSDKEHLIAFTFLFFDHVVGVFVSGTFDGGYSRNDSFSSQEWFIQSLPFTLLSNRNCCASALVDPRHFSFLVTWNNNMIFIHCVFGKCFWNVE